MPVWRQIRNDLCAHWTIAVSGRSNASRSSKRRIRRYKKSRPGLFNRFLPERFSSNKLHIMDQVAAACYKPMEEEPEGGGSRDSGRTNASKRGRQTEAG